MNQSPHNTPLRNLVTGASLAQIQDFCQGRGVGSALQQIQDSGQGSRTQQAYRQHSDQGAADPEPRCRSRILVRKVQTLSQGMGPGF